MDNPECELCKGPMSKVDSVNSGNARYETYRCSTCNTEKTKCVGINQS